MVPPRQGLAPQPATRRRRPVARIAAAVLLAAFALGCVGAPDRRAPGQRQLSAPGWTPSLAPAPPDPRQAGPLGGVPLTGATGLQLLVANDPAPWLVDVDCGTVRPVAGLPTDGERVVWLLPAGREAVVVSDRVCEGCRPPTTDVYRVRPGGTAATRLGATLGVVAAREGRAVWTLTPRAAGGCALGLVGLDGRRQGPARPVACETLLLGDTSAGLLLAAGPPGGSDDPWDWPTVLLDRRGRVTRLGFPAAEVVAADGHLLLRSAEPREPLTLTDLRDGTSRRLAWPSRLRGGTHAASMHPGGRLLAVGFHGLADVGEQGYDLWLLDTATLRWRHLPDLPATDVPAKETAMAWTSDGRLVVLTGTSALGDVVAVWRPGQPRLAIRRLQLPGRTASSATFVVR